MKRHVNPTIELRKAAIGNEKKTKRPKKLDLLSWVTKWDSERNC